MDVVLEDVRAVGFREEMCGKLEKDDVVWNKRKGKEEA